VDAILAEMDIPSKMIVRFCERQTETHDNPVSCSIFHNDHKICEYRPVSDKPIHHIVFAAQEDHCFVYRKGTRLASLTKVQSPARTTAYSCHKVEEAFDPERGRPWCEWEAYYKLQP